MKLLVIGAKGQLGEDLMAVSQDGGWDAVGVDLPECDITSSESLQRILSAKGQYAVVINASAYTAVDQAESDSDTAFAVNCHGVARLAALCRQVDSPLIHVSTDFVFDGAASTPYPPEASCNPLGVYGQSKRQGEINILDGLSDSVIIRTSWLYSQYGNNFVLTMLKLMKERDELKVVADQIGTPTWAATLAAAIWAVAGRRQLKGIYHWSDAGAASWYDFAVAIQEEAASFGVLNTMVPIHPIRTNQFPTPAKRPVYSVLDCTRSWENFGRGPLHWRVALRKMLEGLNLMGAHA